MKSESSEHTSVILDMIFFCNVKIVTILLIVLNSNDNSDNEDNLYKL